MYYSSPHSYPIVLLFSESAHVYYLKALLQAIVYAKAIHLRPEDMLDPDDFDEEESREEGLTELDRRRHVSKEDDADLIEDEDDSFVDELGEEE